MSTIKNSSTNSKDIHSTKNSSNSDNSNSRNDNVERIIPDNARAVCGKELPIVKAEDEGLGSIVLFYQYVEDPVWTKAEHKAALKKVVELGNKFDITGRGRVAQEGLNCTLTGRPHDVRSFCYALREWKKELFNETDFKITDGIPKDKLFKSLSIRKATELVAYGLAGDKAPSLKKFAGEHLEADEYHKAMEDPDTVIIDVRNAYESAIGNFQPPPTGAKLIDPKMRNSIEFPKWLNSEQTQRQLTGKNVLMYCTGGIRCERATALLNQMSTITEDLKPKGVYHCRGGIERYVKTFPDGGYWKGKNYLFDRRMEQTSHTKPLEDVENDIQDAKCCLCHTKWTIYRGQFKCNRSLCRVPVIVCDSCSTTTAIQTPEALVCSLCQQGYKAPTKMPDLVNMKRKAEQVITTTTTTNNNNNDNNNDNNKKQRTKIFYKDRLFLRRVPLTVSYTKIKETLNGGVDKVLWLTDKNHGGFYGSCIVLLSQTMTLQHILDKASSKNGLQIEKKKIKVSQVFQKDHPDDEIFSTNFVQTEFPPIGH